MTTRLIKESRSLWPLVAGGLLALLACSGVDDGALRLALATGVLCLLCAVAGISSMGFELLHGMHLNLFVQPAPREQSWRDKMIVQGAALVIFAGMYAWVAQDMEVNHWSLSRTQDRLAMGAAAPLFAFGCGSLMVLAIRHVQGAFWLLIGGFFLLLTLVEAFWPIGIWEWRWVGHLLVFTALAVVGLALGRREYLAFQNYSVLDRMVSLVGGGDEAQSEESSRDGRWLALVKKELHLQWLNLAVFLTAYLCGVLWGVFKTWTGWAMMKDAVCLGLPIFIGAAAIAEERRLGLHHLHLTLPPIRRQQWQVKLLVSAGLALAVGVGLYAGSAWVLPDYSRDGLLGDTSVTRR